MRTRLAGGGLILALVMDPTLAQAPPDPLVGTWVGSYHCAQGLTAVGAGRWIVRPAGYVGVDFVGRLDATGARLTGEVRGPGCTAFELTKSAAPPPMPSGCSIPVAEGAAR